jgi:thioredoxin-like negative regulator of GroEL
MERFVILAAITVIVALGVIAARHYAAIRAGQLKTAPADPLWASLGVQPDGRPTVVTFSTPSCAACHKAQAPAVSKVQQQLDVRVIRVDAAQRPHVARAFGVLTVPATVVLAEAGHVVAINQGFAPTVKLLEQLTG